MPPASRKLIALGWAIPAAGALALTLSRSWFVGAGKFVGSFVLMLFGVPAFLAALLG